MFGLLAFLIKKHDRQIIFAKNPLSLEGLITIRMKIMGAIYYLKNEYEQIYFFVNISSSNSYQLTEMSFNLRNCTFSETFYSRVECFAPSCFIYKINLQIFKIFQFRKVEHFYKISFSNFEHFSSVIWNFRGQRSTAFDMARLDLCVRLIFFFSKFWICFMFHQKTWPENYFHKSSSIFRRANNYLN